MTDLPDFDALWNYDDPAGTEAKFRALLPAAGAQPAYHAALLTQIARTQGLQRQFEAAHGTLDEAERLIDPSMTSTRIRLFLERGRVYNSSQHIPEAAPLFRAAWDLALAAGEDFYAVDAAHMLGICEPPERQAEWNLRALDLAERSAQPRARGWLGSLYNNLGWTFHDQGDPTRALDLFEKALAFRQGQPGKQAEVLIAQWCVARCLRTLGRVEEALAQQQTLEREHAAAGSGDGYVFEEIAENLRLLGRLAEARPYFARAHAELSADAWLAEQEPARLQRLAELGADE
ncbi:MAG: tetratricopeptide repeat protein [Anaerolineales bacterium]